MDKDDGVSVEKWVALQPTKDILAYKNCSMRPPEGSGLSPLTFLLIYQSKWQRSRAMDIGNNMLHIDGTHNVSCYKNLILYTILGRDEWGHGKLQNHLANFMLSCLIYRNTFGMVPCI